jgi:hypothetical protein
MRSSQLQGLGAERRSRDVRRWRNVAAFAGCQSLSFRAADLRLAAAAERDGSSRSKTECFFDGSAATQLGHADESVDLTQQLTYA